MSSKEDRYLLILQAQERGRLRDAMNIVLENETTGLCSRNGDGNSPKVKLSNGVSWLDFVEAKIQKKQPVRILELGAGDDAFNWTASSGNEKLDSNIKSARGLVTSDNSHIVVQSGCEPLTDVYRNGLVKRYVSGHFVPVLNRLIDERLQFDVVLSTYAIHQTAFCLELLPLIDKLLANGGAAFIDQVTKGRGDGHIVLFDKNVIIPRVLTRDSILYSTLTCREAHVYNLPWDERYGESSAWKKGQLQERNKPNLVKIGWLETFLDPDFPRFVYRKK